MRTGNQVIIEAAGVGTVYSDPHQGIYAAKYVAAQAQRTAGTGTATLTFQGGWDPESTDADDWVDLDFTATVADGALVAFADANGGATIFGTFPYYRIEAVVSAAAATIEIRTVSFD